jgi:hypothetical protein
LLPERPIISGRKLNNVILYLLVCVKKNQVPPMVSRFLLHDPSDMSIGGVSGERKSGIWGRMLEWHRRCQEEAFCILEGLLSGSGPLQHFGPSLQEISQRFQNFSTVWQKAVVKVYHPKETLQLLDILRGGQFLISAA